MTEQRVVQRTSARVVLVDRDDRVLLVEGHDPSRPERGWYWFTVGGGVEPGEDLHAGALREVAEECGLVLNLDELGPVRRTEAGEFPFENLLVRKRDSFFLARVDAFEPDNSGWDELEVRVMRGIRWWPLTDLKTTSESVYPHDLAALVEEAIDRGWV